MSEHTEARIQRLSNEAVAAKTQADVDRILEELRSVLDEHVRLAASKLGAQARSFQLAGSNAEPAVG